MQFGQYAPARRTIVHLSDTHLLAGNAPLGGRYDTEANLMRTLARVEQLTADGAVRPDALVFTGDLTDLGEPGAYARLRELVEPVAARIGAPVVWVAGNHDERPELRRDLLGLPAGQEPVTGVWDLGGLRLIALDTSVPGWHHGEIDAAQREWLRAQLEAPAPLGTILALHHPPLPSHVPVFDILELRDQPALAEVLAGSDVRAILAGHLHYSMSGTFAGIPVSVASASCYTMDVALPPTRVNGMDAGQTFHLVHVYDETVTHTVVPVDADDAAAFFGPEWYDRIARMTREQRLELFSRKPPRG
ncbi:phosphodiesterase [Microbacterium sp. MEC084]|uniref:phosphodiesterase n=1 Tax=Microbacterium sp. MEC084 TaxID=1963027 RepID=UPI00106F7D17|nr:phosphodiesterase [Microbacterium sp. MEC084]MCD1268247.1 phosphodiesterase [Microbacterium sp. MEC084]